MVLFLFWPLILVLSVLTVCVSKKSQKSATSEKSLKSAATSNFSLISDKSERGSSSEKVQRRDRNSTIDSLKVPRRPPQASSMSSSGKSYRKSGNQVSVRGSQKSDTTDSAKTELIEMPLGKAARDEPKHNILTPAAEQKTGDSSPPSKRVQFAHPLKRVKRRATMPPEDADEKTMYIA